MAWGRNPPSSRPQGGIGPVIAGDEIEARRLAGAVRPNERNRLAVADGKAQVLNGAQSAEPPAEMTNDEGLSHRGELPFSPAESERRAHTSRSASKGARSAATGPRR